MSWLLWIFTVVGGIVTVGFVLFAILAAIAAAANLMFLICFRPPW